MKKLLILVLFGVLMGFTAKSQELALSIFENSQEKKLLTKHLHEPFLYMQALNFKEQAKHPRWEILLEQLDQKAFQRNGDVQLLSDIFFKTQKYLLVTYAKHADFSTTLSEGVFDCVTGTAAYALLLDRYGIPYQIVETDEHVFIKGDWNGMPFILESTFPEHGLILHAKEVKAFERKFATGSALSSKALPSQVGHLERLGKSSAILEGIGLRELAGLQYYNDAVEKFYEKQYLATYAQLVKAEFLYPSPRITEFKGKMELLLGIGM